MADRTCLICSGPLPAPHVKFYCSGPCVDEAKRRGLYDHEPDTASPPPEKDNAQLHPAYVRATEELRRKGIIK